MKNSIGNLTGHKIYISIGYITLLKIIVYCIVLYCIEGVVIAAQCTALYSSEFRFFDDPEISD